MSKQHIMDIGSIVEGYKLTELLGEGGMGKVFLAQELRSGEQVAIKVLLHHLVFNRIAIESFEQDAMILKSLNHKNIVRYIHSFENTNGHFIIMEAVKGMPLEKYILRKRGLLPYQEAIEMFNQILDGLIYAHSKGVIHRDIKPENILVTNDGQIKIIDFGIAKLLDSDENLASTMAHQGKGTPFYMSPEQVSGKKVSVTTDVYSAGRVLYFMLTGKNPYESVTSWFDLSKKIVDEELPDPSSYYKFIPSSLDRIIQNALKKEPFDRIQTCQIFKEQLKLTLQESPMERGNFKVKVKGGAAAIFCDKQGYYGNEADFEILLGNKYNLRILSVNGKEILEEISPSDKDILEYDLTSDSSNGFKLFWLVGWGFFVLTLLFLFLYWRETNKKLEGLEKKIENYRNSTGVIHVTQSTTTDFHV